MRTFPATLVLVIASGNLFAAEPQKSAKVFNLWDFHAVDGTDVYMNPGKYIGRPIELRRMTCHPAEGGYACDSPSSRVIVFATTLTPDRERQIIASRCVPGADLYRQRCRRTIRLVPESAEGRKGDGYAQQIILRAKAIDVAPLDSDSSQN